MRFADSSTNPDSSSPDAATPFPKHQGPRRTTFGPYSLLDRRRHQGSNPLQHRGSSPARVTIAALAAAGALTAIFVFVGPGRTPIVWLMLVMGLPIGYFTHRRRSPRVNVQVWLAVAMPFLLTAFFVLVSADAQARVGVLALIPAAILGHVLARLIERMFGPRHKVLMAAWAGVDRVGSAQQPGAVTFDIRPFVNDAAGSLVTRKEAQAFRPYVRRSPFQVRIVVFKWLFIIATPVIAIALVAGFIDEATKPGDDVSSQLVSLSIVTSLIVIGYSIIGWIGIRGSLHLTNLRDHVRFARFAKANGFTYEPGPVLDRFGRELSRVMRADQDRRWVIANALRSEPIPGESSAATTFFGGFCEFQLPVPLPNFLLIARRAKLPEFSSHTAPNPDQKLSLEGDFDRHFTLYCPEGYGRDALYILTPDVMARLVDGAHGFDIEFIDDRLVLRSRGDMVTRDPAQWQRIATAINALNDRVEQWSRWRDERREFFSVGERGHLVVERPAGVAKVGQRLRRAISVGAILVLGYVAVYLGLLYVARELL